MLQLFQKDKEKLFEAIQSGRINAADLSFPNLIDSIILINACVAHDKKTDKY